MSCPKLPACPFFNDRMGGMPAMMAMLKKRYCEGTYTECARFRASEKLGAQGVPPDLFPNQGERLIALGVH